MTVLDILAPCESQPANDTALRLTGRDYVSFSSLLSTYRQCPLRYYFKYVAGLPEDVVTSSLAVGGCVHSAVEHHYRELLVGGPAPGLDTLLDVFWDAWRDRSEQATVQFGKGEDLGTVGGFAERILTAFRESDLARPDGTILGVEEELRGELVPGCPDLLARIDLVVETDDELVVTDLKTARTRWSFEHVEDAGEQLLLYGELARQLAPEKSLRLEFGVITKTKVPAVERYPVADDPQRLERTKGVVERVWRAVESGVFYPAPSPVNCPTCPYRQPCREWGEAESQGSSPCVRLHRASRGAPSPRPAMLSGRPCPPGCRPIVCHRFSPTQIRRAGSWEPHAKS